MAAYLILENGAVFEGRYFGKESKVCGEVVFTTGMTGYAETLTDPSFCEQIIVQTFPLIGNYGLTPDDFESKSVHAKGYIVQKTSRCPSNFRSEGAVDTFLKEQGVVGIEGIDTRALTKIIRTQGVMNGKITNHVPEEVDRIEAAYYKVENPIAQVSLKQCSRVGSGPYRVALMDFGTKKGIIDELVARGCEVTLFPHTASADEIEKIKPHGVLLSNGPGDPSDSENRGIIQEVRKLEQAQIPLFGICLGHQLLALAHGCVTHKLNFGHRGANQPVQDLVSGRTYITSQNHGYAVQVDKSNAACVSFRNNNDDTCEGMDWGSSFSVQFHPEARGGPQDTAFLFDRFIERMDRYATR